MTSMRKTFDTISSHEIASLNGIIDRDTFYDVLLPKLSDKQRELLFGKLLQQAQNLVIKQMSAGQGFTLVLTEDGSVFGSGSSLEGALGCGQPMSREDFPDEGQKQTKFPDNVSIISIAAGGWHSLFLSDDNEVYACGSNGAGQLGLGVGRYGRQHLPIKLTNIPSEDYIKQIAAGGSHSLFLSADGRVYGCGYNTSGELGLGDLEVQPTPVLIPGFPEDTRICCIVANTERSLFLTDTGQVYGCGNNSDGQLGLGDIDYQRTPVLLKGFPADVIIKHIAAGESHSLFISDDGRLFGCGDNTNGQLAQKYIRTLRKPTHINTQEWLNENEQLTQIAAGRKHTLFLTNIGKVYGCGDNEGYQLGRDVAQNIHTPAILGTNNPSNSNNDLADKMVNKIACGGMHSLFLTDARELYGCGSNQSRQLLGVWAENFVEKISCLPSLDPSKRLFDTAHLVDSYPKNPPLTNVSFARFFDNNLRSHNTQHHQDLTKPTMK